MKCPQVRHYVWALSLRQFPRLQLSATTSRSVPARAGWYTRPLVSPGRRKEQRRSEKEKKEEKEGCARPGDGGWTKPPCSEHRVPTVADVARPGATWPRWPQKEGRRGRGCEGAPGRQPGGEEGQPVSSGHSGQSGEIWGRDPGASAGVSGETRA